MVGGGKSLLPRMVKYELIEYRKKCIQELNTIELDLCEGETIIARESID